MGAPNIQISKALLDKLAGKHQRRSPEPELQQPRSPLGLPLIPHEVAASLAADARMRKALAASQRVGRLLLKSEEEEVARVKQYAEELLGGPLNFQPKPTPCQQEEADCLSCYEANAQDPLRCASFVQAYSRCAAAARS